MEGGIVLLHRMPLVWASMDTFVSSWGIRARICVAFLDVSRHGYVNVPHFVVPIECYATIEVAFPIFGEFLFALLEACDEVISVLFPDVFDAEVIHN